MSAACPKCNYPVSTKEKNKGQNSAGCGCLLVVLSIVLGIIPVIGWFLGVITFGIGLYLIIFSGQSKKEIPYCSNCGWEGK